MAVKYTPIENHYIQLDIAFATEYGINEALIFDKLHRLMTRWQGFIDEKGVKWIRLTYDEWKDELPFLSRNTIIRAIESMLEKKLVFSTVFKGRSKWYRYNSEFLSTQNGYIPKMGTLSTQNGYLPNSLPNSTTSTTNVVDVTPPKKSQKSSKSLQSKQPPTSFIRAAVKKKKKSPAKIHPAIAEYRNIIERFPPKGMYSRIEQAVGDTAENLSTWRKAIIVSLENWSGDHTPPPIRFIEVFNCNGDYEQFKAWKWPKSNGAKQNGSTRQNDSPDRKNERTAHQKELEALGITFS